MRLLKNEYLPWVDGEQERQRKKRDERKKKMRRRRKKRKKIKMVLGREGGKQPPTVTTPPQTQALLHHRCILIYTSQSVHSKHRLGHFLDCDSRFYRLSYINQFKTKGSRWEMDGCLHVADDGVQVLGGEFCRHLPIFCSPGVMPRQSCHRRKKSRKSKCRAEDKTWGRDNDSPSPARASALEVQRWFKMARTLDRRSMVAYAQRSLFMENSS